MTINIILDLLAVIISCVCLLASFRNRPSYGQKLAMILCASCFLIFTGQMGVHIGRSHSMMIYSEKVEMIGIAGAIAVIIIFAGQLSGRDLPLPVKTIIMLNCLCVDVYVLLTNHRERVYKNEVVITADGRLAFSGRPKPVMIYLTIWAFLALIYMIVLDVKTRKLRRRRRNYRFFLLSVAFPAIGIIMSLQRNRINFTAIFSIFGMFVLLYIIYTTGYDVNGLGMTDIVEKSMEGAAIVNNYGEVMYCNNVMRKAFPALRYTVRGDDVPESVKKEYEGRKEGAYTSDRVRYEGNIYKPDVMPLNDEKGQKLGTIYLLVDVTDVEERRKSQLNYSSQLEEMVWKRAKELLSAREKMLTGFSEIVEFKDSTTGGHIKRTSEYCHCITSEMLDENLIAGITASAMPDLMRRYAPLHDIGKIYIPDRILNKPGKLTAEEFELIKTHTVRGGQIITHLMEQDPSHADEYQIARNIALYHHERFDGTGYPEGKKGENIPLPARIMSVADVFDALMSRRPYKAAFTLEDTLRIMKEGRGTQFDPDIFDCFMNCVPKLVKIREETQPFKAEEK